MEQNKWRRKNANANCVCIGKMREHFATHAERRHGERESESGRENGKGRDEEKNNNVKLVWCSFLIVAMLVIIIPAIFRVVHAQPSLTQPLSRLVLGVHDSKNGARTHRHFPTNCTTKYTQAHFISKSERHFPNAIHPLATISRAHSHGYASMSSQRKGEGWAQNGVFAISRYPLPEIALRSSDTKRLALTCT